MMRLLRARPDPAKDRASLPFEFGEGPRGVPSIILLEQPPAILFRLTGTLGSRGEGDAGLDQTADVARQTFQVAPLVLQRAGPIVDCRPMTRNDAPGRDARHLIHHRQPSPDASV